MPEKKTIESSTPQGEPVELVDLAEVAKRLRLSPVQLRKMVQSGQIPGVKVDGQWKFNFDLVRERLVRRSRGR